MLTIAARCRVLIAMVALGGCGIQAPRQELQLRVTEDAPFFVVAPLTSAGIAAIEKLEPEQQSELFQVFVAGEHASSTPLSGSVTIRGNELRFTPRYRLEPGLSYRAVFRVERLAGGGDPTSVELSNTFEMPAAPEAPETVVEHIYPSAARLPENQLKFYLHFSAPMSRGEAYRHIHLYNSVGQEVEAAFLELGEELWDPAMRRFTLLCDPGRVKRGLKPREELGPVLEEGRDYTLVVDRDWLDASSRPLGAEARKSIHVLPPDDAAIDPEKWQIEPPVARSRDALSVRFGESLDHALLERMIWVVAPDSKKLAGEIAVSDEETTWRFSPTEPWTAGDYQLVVNTALEDLAGNAIGRAFDVDVFEKVQKQIETQTIAIRFRVNSEKKN